MQCAHLHPQNPPLPWCQTPNEYKYVQNYPLPTRHLLPILSSLIESVFQGSFNGNVSGLPKSTQITGSCLSRDFLPLVTALITRRRHWLANGAWSPLGGGYSKFKGGLPSDEKKCKLQSSDSCLRWQVHLFTTFFSEVKLVKTCALFCRLSARHSKPCH